MVKIRVSGSHQDIKATLAELSKVLRVMSISPPYANRDGSGYRVYVEAEPERAAADDGAQ